MKLASFFSGAGGLDQGFKREGFSTLFANEFDPQIANTFAKNHPQAKLYVGSIADLLGSELLPTGIDGFIGGPPCQSWSAAGAKRGADDPRGQLFFTYLNLIERYQPKFFVAENVPGILTERNKASLESLLRLMTAAGYNVSFGLMNAANYGVAQDRKRVIFVGIRKDLNTWFARPQENKSKKTLMSAIGDLDPRPRAAHFGESFEFDELTTIENHHYLESKHFSPIYMSRNRVRPWSSQSFTIQASASHAPLHPIAPAMQLVEKDKFRFDPSSQDQYRRLSVRECARIQDFPDSYIFDYRTIGTGYKMVGNAVPVGLAAAVARGVKMALLHKWQPNSAVDFQTYNF